MVGSHQKADKFSRFLKLSEISYLIQSVVINNTDFINVSTITLFTNLISPLMLSKMYRLFSFLSFCAVALGAAIPCKKTPGAEEYIIGGKVTNITEVPYQVSLHWGSRFICGGSIISATHVLTAAHCVIKNYEQVSYNVRAGSSEEIRNGIVVPVKQAFSHPKFSAWTVDYDVAVLELSTPLTFTDSIKPIKVAHKEPKDNELVKTSGWGCTKEDGPRPYYLQSVVVPMVNRKTCETNYEKHLKITPRMICAGVEGKDACQGDSGGPLAYKDTLVGIVSTGVGCARKDYPGIYTNVADPEVRKFILEHANV